VRASIELADIFRSVGPAYRAAHAGHLNLGQLKGHDGDRELPYARERARDLAQHMAWEQRRAAREVAQRRREWNEE